MKLRLTEKQIKSLFSAELEEETPPAPSTGGGGGSAGYPQVGKWESGATRGPANQIGLTKWSDIVGSVLKREKANQLK